MTLCVCVCVCVRERERERERVCVCVFVRAQGKDGLYHLSPTPLTETLITGLYTLLHHTHHCPDRYTHTRTHIHTEIQQRSGIVGPLLLSLYISSPSLFYFSSHMLSFPTSNLPSFSHLCPFLVLFPSYFISLDPFFFLFINTIREQINDV